MVCVCMRACMRACMRVYVCVQLPHLHKLKGTVRRYWSCAITHYFTGSEIITEPKVCVILRYLSKDGA